MTTFGELEEMSCSRSVSIDMKGGLYGRGLVLTAMYGEETWHMKPDVAETNCARSVYRVTRLNKVQKRELRCRVVVLGQQSNKVDQNDSQ